MRDGMAKARKIDFVWPGDAAGRLETIQSALHDPDQSRWVLEAMGACKGGIRRMVFHNTPKTAGQRRTLKSVKRSLQGTIASYWHSPDITYEDRQWWLTHLYGASAGLTAQPRVSSEDEQAIESALRVVYPSSHWRAHQKRQRLLSKTKAALLYKRVTVMGRMRT